MKTRKNNQYTLIHLQETSSTYFTEQLAKIKSDHFVLNISDEVELDEKKIELLLHARNRLNADSKSLVVIKKRIDIELVPESLNIVPTLQEAEDLLQFEAIERELGM